MTKSKEKALLKFTPGTAKARLLYVLSKPENYLLPISGICKQAKISRTWYYKLYKNKKFRARAIALANQIFASATPAVAHKVAKQAVEGSLAHQGIILEATGVVQPVGATGQTQVNIFTRLSKDEGDYIEGEKA